METNYVYWPYDEVSLHPDANKLLVKSPWIQASVSMPEDERAQILDIVAKSQTTALTVEDFQSINEFFTQLDKYPLCYILPTQKTGKLDNHIATGTEISQASPDQVLKLAAGEKAQGLAPLNWKWDAEAALSFSSIGDLIHPESLFCYARRFHLLDVVENDQGKEVFAKFQSLQGDEFRKAASLLVRQNHFVTQKCQESLLPALNSSQSARPLVEDFIHEEKGHDRILNLALQALVDDPSSVPVSSQTEVLMALLKFAAEKNFLAFAMAVEFFERSSYEDSDPLAQLLEKGGFADAAKQINRHMAINDVGEHENVGCGLLKFMAPCDRTYALEALRIAEVISTVMSSVTASTLTLFQ